MEHPFAAEASGEKPRRRDYEKALDRLEKHWKRRGSNRARMMQEIVDALWDIFGERIFSWCGFYVPSASGSELTLGPHRDRPACSPIGMHGACGKAMTTKTPQIVPDVKKLGDAYVECHPETRSEIAIPVIDLRGAVFAVLDVDSGKADAFGDEDRRWLERIVKELSQTNPPDLANY